MIDFAPHRKFHTHWWASHIDTTEKDLRVPNKTDGESAISPTAFSQKGLTAAEEAKIVAPVKKAAS